MAPLTHAVGNVLKRVFVIGFSILVFGKIMLPTILGNLYTNMDNGLNDTTRKYLISGNKISLQTGIGTSIAIAGVAMYSFIKAKMEEEKRVRPTI